MKQCGKKRHSGLLKKIYQTQNATITVNQTIWLKHILKFGSSTFRRDIDRFLKSLPLRLEAYPSGRAWPDFATPTRDSACHPLEMETPCDNRIKPPACRGQISKGNSTQPVLKL